jgi:hypothetical protein
MQENGEISGESSAATSSKSSETSSQQSKGWFSSAQSDTKMTLDLDSKILCLLRLHLMFHSLQ